MSLDPSLILDHRMGTCGLSTIHPKEEESGVGECVACVPLSLSEPPSRNECAAEISFIE